MSVLLRSGLVRGLVGQLAGTLAGMAAVVAVRLAIGRPGWSAEPATVVGAVVGVAGFMIAVGALTDWWRWAKGLETPLRHGHSEGKPEWSRYLNVDYSHKVIGIQYTITSLVLMLVGGLLALTMRTELADAGLQFMSSTTYSTLVGMHGIVMIAAILVGVGGMSNYLVPLMIGASDMAFPRLNAFAYWVNVPGALLVVASMFAGGWNTGWTGYPPLSAQAPLGQDLFFLGVYMVGLSSILGSMNLIVTTLRLRMPGMSLSRLPIFVWAMLATSIIGLTATQFIGLSFLMVVLQRTLGLGFFDPNLSSAAAALGSPAGKPLLFQHLFWFYSHPAVYVFILPGLGIISELLPVFCRKPLFGYRWVAMSSMAIALVGFLVWAHHMFTSGIGEAVRIPMMYTTLLVAVPTGVKFFSWVATAWRGKLVFPTPMLFVLGAFFVFLLGGLTGPPNGMVITDLYLHDTYWVVGHFHATMFGGFVFAFFAALYYWFPKAIGRMYDERLGKIHFWLMTPAFFVMSLGQIRVGLMGMRRRIADYDPALGIDTTHFWITVAGFVIGFSILLMLYNFIRSARRGAPAPANPWRSRSPEWLIPSPPPEISYEGRPTAVGRPYDYGLPGSVYVSLAEPAVGPS